MTQPTPHDVVAGDSRLEVWTYKAGLLSKVAHDLCIAATGFRAPLTLQPDGGFSVEVTARVDALRVRGQVTGGDVTPLKPKDHAEIEGNIQGRKVLDGARHPEIRFVASGAALTSGPVEGRLTLHGAERPLRTVLTVTNEGGQTRVEGEVRFNQTDWGIKPFSALLGALKIKDEVRISWRLVYDTQMA